MALPRRMAARRGGAAAWGGVPRAGAAPKRLPPAAAGQRGGGPPWMGAAMPAEKALNFGPSTPRPLRRMRPTRAAMVLVLGLAAGSVTLAVIGPRLLGHATNTIFAGFIG